MKKIHSKKPHYSYKKWENSWDGWLILEDGSFVIFIMIPGALLSVSFSWSLIIKMPTSEGHQFLSLAQGYDFRAAGTGSARAQQCTKMGTTEVLRHRRLHLLILAIKC